MNRTLMFWISICMVLLAQLSCDDIIEKDITDTEIIFVVPSDSAVLDDNDVSFLWEPVEDVNSYLLQVARPDFKNAKTIELDTLLTDNRYSIRLDSGSYEWRVKGFNSAYQTAYYYHFFTVSKKIEVNSEE